MSSRKIGLARGRCRPCRRCVGRSGDPACAAPRRSTPRTRRRMGLQHARFRPDSSETQLFVSATATEAARSGSGAQPPAWRGRGCGLLLRCAPSCCAPTELELPAAAQSLFEGASKKASIDTELAALEARPRSIARPLSTTTRLTKPGSGMSLVPLEARNGVERRADASTPPTSKITALVAHRAPSDGIYFFRSDPFWPNRISFAFASIPAFAQVSLRRSKPRRSAGARLHLRRTSAGHSESRRSPRPAARVDTVHGQLAMSAMEYSPQMYSPPFELTCRARGSRRFASSV